MTKIIHDYEMNLKNEGNFHFFEKIIEMYISVPLSANILRTIETPNLTYRLGGVTPSLPHIRYIVQKNNAAKIVSGSIIF